MSNFDRVGDWEGPRGGLLSQRWSCSSPSGCSDSCWVARSRRRVPSGMRFTHSTTQHSTRSSRTPMRPRNSGFAHTTPSPRPSASRESNPALHSSSQSPQDRVARRQWASGRGPGVERLWRPPRLPGTHVPPRVCASFLHSDAVLSWDCRYDKLKVTKVNTYGLVFHWQGSTDAKPILLAAHQG